MLWLVWKEVLYFIQIQLSPHLLIGMAGVPHTKKLQSRMILQALKMYQEDIDDDRTQSVKPDHTYLTKNIEIGKLKTNLKSTSIDKMKGL